MDQFGTYFAPAGGGTPLTAVTEGLKLNCGYQVISSKFPSGIWLNSSGESTSNQPTAYAQGTPAVGVNLIYVSDNTSSVITEGTRYCQ